MSYAEIDAERVKVACQEYIVRHNNRINAEKEALIQNEMKCGWFRKAKTREQAINSLRNEGWTGEWFAIELTGSIPFSRVESLFALANAKGVDKIMIKAEDARLLGL